MNLCALTFAIALGALALACHAMTEAERRALLQQREFFDREYEAEERGMGARYHHEYRGRY